MRNAGRGSSGNRQEHPSVKALLAAHPEDSDPRKIIRQIAREKIAYAKRLGWSGPPFDPKILTSLFGIRCKEVDHEIKSDGRLIRYPDGKPWIEYCNEGIAQRQRFTIFHEFAHTFFPDFCDYLPLQDSLSDDISNSEKRFENLCDVAAAEMIMPIEDFQRDLKAVAHLDCEAVLKLADRYQASIDAAMLRTIDLTDSISCAAIFLTDQKGTHNGTGPLWVKYSWPGPLFKGFVFPGTTSPKDSVVLDCYSNGSAVSRTAKETWWLKGKPRTWLVQAIKLPVVLGNATYPKVVALILPNSYERSIDRSVQ